MTGDHPKSDALSSKKYYEQRDHYGLSPHFERHMLALTAEGLESKSAIAAELAYRDAQIESLQRRIAELSGEHGQVETSAQREDPVELLTVARALLPDPDFEPSEDREIALRGIRDRIDVYLAKSPVETAALLPGEDIAEALERQGDALSARAARHIRIKWQTEEGLRQQLDRALGQLNAMPEQSKARGESYNPETVSKILAARDGPTALPCCADFPACDCPPPPSENG